jgi:hypothetical protein
MYPSWRGFCGSLTLAASLAVLGCGSSSTSNVRAVNASPGYAPFTFQVGQTEIAGLSYGTEGVEPKGQYSTVLSTGIYRPIGAGTNQTVTAYTAPGSPALATATQTFAANTNYTVVSVGTSPGMQLVTLTDNGTGANSPGGSFRFLDTATTTGSIDVYITPVGGSPSGNPVIGNLPFNHLQNYIAASTGEIQVTPHGSTQVLATAAFSPAGGALYSVFFLDPNPASTSGSSYSLLIVNDPVPAGSGTAPAGS